MLKALLGIKKRISPRLIPNESAYQFYARLVDGTEVLCETYQTDFAIRHTIRTVESKIPISFKQIQDWTEV